MTVCQSENAEEILKCCSRASVSRAETERTTKATMRTTMKATMKTTAREQEFAASNSDLDFDDADSENVEMKTSVNQS